MPDVRDPMMPGGEQAIVEGCVCPRLDNGWGNVSFARDRGGWIIMSHCPLHGPGGGDMPMRDAVERAYRRVTGRDAEFTFSGWGGELTEPERAVVEDRLPRPFNGNDAALLKRMGTDASKWAEEFYLRFGPDPSKIDQDLLRGWFANAIEAGRDAA